MLREVLEEVVGEHLRCTEHAPPSPTAFCTWHLGLAQSEVAWGRTCPFHSMAEGCVPAKQPCPTPHPCLGTAGPRHGVCGPRYPLPCDLPPVPACCCLSCHQSSGFSPLPTESFICKSIMCTCNVHIAERANAGLFPVLPPVSGVYA